MAINSTTRHVHFANTPASPKRRRHTDLRRQVLERASASAAIAARAASTPIRTGLPRPASSRAPKRDIIEATEPTLSHVPTNYILHALDNHGPEMYKALRATRATVPTGPLPSQLGITLSVPTRKPPTHMLAVHSRRSPNLDASVKTRVTLYPAHALVLAGRCANLPVLPEPCANAQTSTSDRTTIPVVPLSLPDGSSFPALLDFIYHRNQDALIRALLRPVLNKIDRPAAAARIHGLWRDACALGVCDDKFWEALDVAWNVVSASRQV